MRAELSDTSPVLATSHLITEHHEGLTQSILEPFASNHRFTIHNPAPNNP